MSSSPTQHIVVCKEAHEKILKFSSLRIVSASEIVNELILRTKEEDLRDLVIMIAKKKVQEKFGRTNHEVTDENINHRNPTP